MGTLYKTLLLFCIWSTTCCSTYLINFSWCHFIWVVYHFMLFFWIPFLEKSVGKKISNHTFLFRNYNFYSCSYGKLLKTQKNGKISVWLFLKSGFFWILKIIVDTQESKFLSCKIAVLNGGYVMLDFSSLIA